MCGLWVWRDHLSVLLICNMLILYLVKHKTLKNYSIYQDHLALKCCMMRKCFSDWTFWYCSILVFHRVLCRQVEDKIMCDGCTSAKKAFLKSFYHSCRLYWRIYQTLLTAQLSLFFSFIFLPRNCKPKFSSCSDILFFKHRKELRWLQTVGWESILIER